MLFFPSGERNGNPLQFPCLENSMDRGAWQAAAHGVAKSQTQLSTYIPLPICFSATSYHLGQMNSGHEVILDLFAFILLNKHLLSTYCVLYVCVLTQPCPTLCYPMDSRPPASAVHEISQAETLDSVAISYSRGSSLHGDCTPRLLYLLHWQSGSLPLSHLLDTHINQGLGILL